MKSKKAFTLVEIMVTLVVFTIVIASVLTIYMNSQRAAQRVDLMTQAQQAARTAIDYMIKDIRAAGYNIDLEETATTSPQRRIVYASPYTLIFNANIKPVHDNPEDPLSPQAYDPTVNPKPSTGSGSVYSPGKKYETGAETIVYTLDYNNDGVISAADRNAPEAAFTGNPDDYAIVKRVFGYDTLTNTNNGVNQVVSIVGGPDKFPGQTEGTPVFQYWYDDDNDPSTPNVLWGDTDGDGELSQTEANNLSASSSADFLDRIRRITINITGVSTEALRGEYMTSNIQTDVSVTRNASINVKTVTGHVYHDINADSTYDSGEPGLAGFKVRLNTGEMTYTDANGIWSFALISGTYSATCTPQIGVSPTTDLYFDFSLGDADMDLTADPNLQHFFGFQTTDTARVVGFAFIDENADGQWQGSEEWLDSVRISVWNNDALTMTGDPATDPYFGVYDLKINAEETLYVWVDAPVGYASTGIDTYMNGEMVFDTMKDNINYLEILDERSFAVNIPADSKTVVAVGLTEAKGLPPYLELLSPNGGETFILDQLHQIRVKAYDPDGTIERFRYSLSLDGGDTWSEIASAPYPTIEADSTFTYDWNVEVPDTNIEGSTICLMRVACEDDSNWTVYDESDYYFTIVGEEGYRNMYFTAEKVDATVDETLFLKSEGIDPDSTLPRYINTINSYASGQSSDTFKFNGSVSMERLYTQSSKYIEFVTKPRMPYADTIYPGVWKFWLVGWTDDDQADVKHFDLKIFRTDSTGADSSMIPLFSTDTIAPVKATGILNASAPETLYVDVPKGFDMNRTDRLYFEIFWSGSSNSGGNPNAEPQRIYFQYGGDEESRLRLPPKP
ncbi:MAG: prepilin-type N-terminal cleavage/methylation domain-containing protein [bacterium]